MRKITIKTIPDSHQRYNTVGDYYTDERGNRIFAVSDMNNWKFEFLVAIHELVESALCQDRGVTDAAIDAFDLSFEEKRLKGEVDGEPGNDPSAPYYKEHQFASKIEKMLADELDVDWEEYYRVCDKLDRNTEVI